MFNARPESIRQWALRYKGSNLTSLQSVVLFLVIGTLVTFASNRRIPEHLVRWIVGYASENPLSFLRETAEKFQQVHGESISISSLYNILRSMVSTIKLSGREPNKSRKYR